RSRRGDTRQRGREGLLARYPLGVVRARHGPAASSRVIAAGAHPQRCALTAILPTRSQHMSTVPTMTFEQFQATRAWSEDLGKALKDATWDNLPEPATGYLYMDTLFIDEVRAWWPEDARDAGRWHLLLERSEYIDNDLEALERKLYGFAIQAGYC